MLRTTGRLLAALTTPMSCTAILHCTLHSHGSLYSASSLLSRSYLSSASSVRTSQLVSTPRTRRDVPLDVVPAPPSAAQSARRNAASEQAKRDKRQLQQLPYNAYNTQLSHNIKQLTTWTALLTALTTELSSTQYNKQTADRYLHPNKKYTQLTHQTLHAITTQLIKFRRTRHAVIAQADPRLMRTLAQFIRVLEMAAPAMYEGKVAGGRWRLLYHPYRYLRAVVEQWRQAAEGRVRLQQRKEDERKEEEAIRREGGVTPDDIKRRIEQVRRKRKEAQAAGAEGAEGGEGDNTVAAMRGLPTAEEARELAAMSDDQKLKMQVQMMLEQEKNQRRKANQQPTKEEEEPKPSSRERRKGKPPVFFTSPR